MASLDIQGPVTITIQCAYCNLHGGPPPSVPPPPAPTPEPEPELPEQAIVCPSPSAAREEWKQREKKGGLLSQMARRFKSMKPGDIARREKKRLSGKVRFDIPDSDEEKEEDFVVKEEVEVEVEAEDEISEEKEEEPVSEPPEEREISLEEEYPSIVEELSKTSDLIDEILEEAQALPDLGELGIQEKIEDIVEEVVEDKSVISFAELCRIILNNPLSPQLMRRFRMQFACEYKKTHGVDCDALAPNQRPKYLLSRALPIARTLYSALSD